MSFGHVRITLKIVSSEGDTFSESFYRASETLGKTSPTREGPVLSADALIVKRRVPLADAFRIRSCTITPALRPGESAPPGSLTFRVVNGKGDAAKPRDVGATTQLVAIRTASGHTRQYGMHGVVDQTIAFDPNGQEILGVGPQSKEFLDYLCNASNGWQMRITTKAAGDVGNPLVLDITVAGGTVAFKIDGLAQLAPGAKFKISGAKGYKVSQFNGDWKVESHDLGTKTISCKPRRLIDPNFFYEKPSAKYRAVNEDLINFANFAGYDGDGARGSSRKVGNSFERRRGRRSARR